MTTTESISIIVGVLGAVVGLISFFAAIVFYVQGNKLNRQSEKILSDIDAKVNLIQGDYGKFVDKSFDLAAGNVVYISDKLSQQMDILESSLKIAIKESIELLSASVTDLNRRPERTLANLETNINRLIEERVEQTKKETTRIIEVSSGSRASEEAIEHYIMKALRHGSILTISIIDYLRSHCLEISLQQLTSLLDRLCEKGLIEKDKELTSRLPIDKDKPSAFWRLTHAGRIRISNGSQG